ncbi:MAG: hypothetical protein M1418_03180 [Deltaproteobacteria bacterium]|nr:hypothetical protein [Deltaproteobacteria bacterium]
MREPGTAANTGARGKRKKKQGHNRQGMMDQRTNRTFICSVLFIEIVEYSAKSVEEQIWLKERFNALLSERIKDIAVNDRIILDTGDGAAIGFLGDPEDALFVAMELRDSAQKEQRDPPLSLSIRMGINLGPVKLVKDINQQLNLIGDGINVAQRVMSFADPGKLLVSRSYYEVISCLSQEYAKLFSYEGLHADKHIRQHRIYAVGNYELKKVPGSRVPVNRKPIPETNPARRMDLPQPEIRQSIGTQASGQGKTIAIPSVLLQLPFHKKWLYAAIPLTLLVILFVAFSLRGGKGTTENHNTSKVATAVSKPQSSGKSVAPSNAKKADTPGPATPTQFSPNSHKKAAKIGFTLSDADRKGHDITLTVKLKNTATDGRSVALYDASYSWPKSRLIAEGGRSYDVQEVYYRKGGKKITMYDTGKTGIPVGGGAMVTIYLVFKNFPDGSRRATLNLHPFVYHGRSWTEHDVKFPDISLE